MSNKGFALFVILLCLFGFNGCNKEQPVVVDKCGIDGIVDVGTTAFSYPNGIKVSLVSVSDPSVKHVAVTDANGAFQFRDIESGSYSVNAEKEGYRWVWMVDDGVVNYRDRIIELSGNQTKDLKILMNGEVDALDIIDLNGNPITKIGIPRNATTISIRLYNGTQSSHQWEFDYERCYVATTFELEYVFSSFNVREGILAPGDNIVLVGTINPNIFSPQFQFIQGVVYLSDYGNVGNMFNSYELYFED
jgi:hypothetical protein